ncbi:phosphotransferase, partial [[Ruminococcus] lactaris]|uniref:phosphotransferase n=1 Tax=[Ruminococcus] lactaris TaxID=46228 RepID=UPI00307B5484
MNITDLGGHSGCKILLCEKNNNEIFVRKISSDKNYNKRLAVQAKKQATYSNPNIKVPKVLQTGYTDDGLFYFDMEYVQGITMAEYIKTIEIGKVRSICESIVNNIVSRDSENTDVDESIFTTKIASLKEKLQPQNNPVINDAIELLNKHSWKRFRKTQCHGDLTLENIIVKDNQLYLIDFLDSFYDCWIMDISTIMQDVQTMWSYRHDEEAEINTKLRLLVFRDILMDTVKRVSPEDYLEVYYALLLKLIRIFPYTKDKETYDFLNDKTTSIINIIREMEGCE